MARHIVGAPDAGPHGEVLAEVTTWWPDHARQAAEHGNSSSLSIPVAIDERRSGALNIYAREAGAFDAESRAAATRFGPCAGVALANFHAYEDALIMSADVQAALESGRSSTRPRAS